MCIPDSRLAGTICRNAQAGISFVELIIFIVVVGLGVAGILTVLNLTAQKSADPMVRKQMLAVAESLLEEVELMPFTYCDPNDPNAATATSAAGCTIAEGTTPQPAGETRGNPTNPFDNVGDYGGYSTSGGMTDITGSAVPGLSAYNASVSVSTQSLGGIPASESLLITVTVTGPNGQSYSLSGYRTRYAPNALP
ncbi:MAG TPA: type II secretion system protein [Burkholderiales bacterium]|nr:type II secretion system protein [Burkholderiales bacterium]